jgi:L-erythrulose 1-phosphate isomerase
MKKIWIGTNWKMTKTIAEGRSYTEELIQFSEDLTPNIELFIIPSHTALVPIQELTSNSRVHLGAQNMHWEESGAYTGEISPRMLDEIGIDIIELGHSERRQYFNETDRTVNKKVLAALKFGIRPLICIGENLQQKNDGIFKETLATQLKVALKNVPIEQVNNILLAYEPVWAIGENGIPADASYVSEIHTYLRQVINEMYSVSTNTPLLFGGSVNLDNFIEYINIPEVNGLFIGRSAWDMESFKDILLQLETNLFK